MAIDDPSLDAYGPPGGARPPRVRFSAIGEAWELFKDQWGTWVFTSLVVVVVNSAVAAALSEVFPDGLNLRFGKEGVALNPPPPGSFLAGLVEALLNGFLYGGMFRMACLQIRGERVHVSDLFGVGNVAKQLAIGSSLTFVLFSVGATLCFLPGLIVGGVLMFVPPLIVDGRVRGVDAIKWSWGALKGQIFKTTVFHCVVVMIHGLGLACCGVGLVFTMPMYCLSISVLYRDYFLAKAPPYAKTPVTGDPDF